MNRNLSQIIVDLFSRPLEGKELEFLIQRFSDEVRKVFESESTPYGKFRGLLESFRTIIPDEKQRYQAALQALSTTSKMNRQEVIRAIGGQLEELKILEKGMMPSLPRWREGLRTMEARSLEIKGEMARLRERIAQLEVEERTILAGKAAREKDVEQAEKEVQELFTNLGAEIAALSRKVEELTGEGTAMQQVLPVAQPVPPAPQPATAEPPLSSSPGKEEGRGEQTIEIQGAPPPQNAKFQRKCPMCGGQMIFLELENMWQCFTCAHEESTDAAHGGSAPAPAGARPAASPSSGEYEGAPEEPSVSAGQPSSKKKPCPVCKKKMFWYPNEKAWRCPSCHYERRI